MADHGRALARFKSGRGHKAHSYERELGYEQKGHYSRGMALAWLIGLCVVALIVLRLFPGK